MRFKRAKTIEQTPPRCAGALGWSLRPLMWSMALAAALLLAACGGPESLLESGDLSEAEKSRIAEAWRDCLAADGIRGEIDFSNGIDIGVELPDGVSEEQVQATEAKCEPILNDLDAVPDMSPEQQAELADAALEVQKCLAAEGYVVTVDQYGINSDSADQPADFDEAAYAEAEDRCFREAAPELYEEFGGQGG